jgi:phosphatidylglycerol:prolipoprotein diacylglycerol transferase
MGSALALLTIEIGIDPEIARFGDLLLTWHGVFTALGIAVGVYAAVLIGRRFGYIDDDIYGAALIGIPCGIIGARALFVAEHWGEPDVNTLLDTIRINEGGISIYGAVIGGFIGGGAYAYLRRVNMWRALDVAAAGLILGMGIGRIGDLINGEHFAKPSSLPWAVAYTHPDSPSRLAHPDACALGITPSSPLPNPDNICGQHPAVGYEMIGDVLIFGMLLFLIFRFRRDGLAFFSMLLVYSLMRFGVTELRIDSEEVFGGLTVPQVTAMCIIPFALLGTIWAWRRGPTDNVPSYKPGYAPRPASASAARQT